MYNSRHQITTQNLASLSADHRWRRAWGLLLAVASLLLLTSFTYHSYQVHPGKTNKQHKMVFQTFSSAVFSHVSLSKAEGPWPALTICERQGLSRSHIQRIVSLLTGWYTGRLLLMKLSIVLNRLLLMVYRPLVSTAGVGRKLASYLTWSFSPNLARYFPVAAPGACDLVQILLYTCTMQLVKIHPPGHLADCTLYT